MISKVQNQLVRELLNHLLKAKNIIRVIHVGEYPCIFDPDTLATEQIHVILNDNTTTNGYPIHHGYYYIIVAMLCITKNLQIEQHEIINQILKHAFNSL
jgi:hypothetical protein